jgi:hypothetical protein
MPQAGLSLFCGAFTLPEFGRGAADNLSESLAEIALVGVSDGCSDFLNPGGGIQKQLHGLAHADEGQIIEKRFSGFFPEYTGQISFRNSQPGSGVFQA